MEQIQSRLEKMVEETLREKEDKRRIVKENIYIVSLAIGAAGLLGGIYWASQYLK